MPRILVLGRSRMDFLVFVSFFLLDSLPLWSLIPNLWGICYGEIFLLEHALKLPLGRPWPMTRPTRSSHYIWWFPRGSRAVENRSRLSKCSAWRLNTLYHDQQRLFDNNINNNNRKKKRRKKRAKREKRETRGLSHIELIRNSYQYSPVPYRYGIWNLSYSVLYRWANRVRSNKHNFFFFCSCVLSFS